MTRLLRGLPALLLAACQAAAPRTVEIVAVNYAFDAPAEVPAGPAVFRLVNRGSVPHEAQVFRFRRGVGADSGLRLLATENTPDSLYDASGAVLISPPGDSGIGGVFAELRPGETWAFVCQFRDSTGAPEHAALGMVKVLAVR